MTREANSTFTAATNSISDGQKKVEKNWRIPAKRGGPNTLLKVKGAYEQHFDL